MTPVKAIALDVDGVLTDGGVWWGPEGQEWKRFSFVDIMGVSLARKAGFVIALISGEDSPLIDRFAMKMGITHIEKNCKDKAAALRHFADASGLMLAEICFMGAAMKLAGMAAAPANAQPVAKSCASFVSANSGGYGAVRELVEMLVAARLVREELHSA
jgi:3-deoxy-D-manno-octulosonate 8-phosphate phosphatase (KDO 8-P phosphatase)